MIIHRADMFGLGQLYQIRGRIGRSKQRAYAYLTYDPKKPLAKNAEKRLEVMETLDNLGSGFQLASYDMDIRGAGNILGEEQSGHIKEVGVELYQQMLEEAVATVRASGSLDNAIFQDRFSPQISVGAAIMIPEAYIPDLNIRMSLYRRLSDLEHGEDLDAIAAEMVDRFGTLPQEVENLLEIMTLKKLCHRARIDRLDAGSKGMVISFHQNKPNNPEKLMHWIHERRGFVKIRPDQKLLISKNWETIPARIDGVKGFIEGLVGVLG
jgi:transcription-repair coupling factor (superfamily II helicase)